MFTDRFAYDLAACIQYPTDDRCINLGHVAFEHRGPIHHRDPRNADVVFDRESLTLQRACVSSFD